MGAPSTSPGSARASGGKRWAFRLIAIGLSVLASEVALTAVRTLVPAVDYHLSPPWDRITVEDPVLGHRPTPAFPEHDAWGFRNAEVPDRCDVLAVGDSLTYGYTAKAEEAWPRVLANRTGRSVYSLSFGGFGPTEFAALVEQGLGLDPSVVVVATYLGNDVSDAYKAVYLEERFADFATRDPAVRDTLVATDRERGTLPEELHRLLGWEHDPGATRSIGMWVAEESSLYGLLRALVSGFSSEGGTELPGDDPDAFDFAASAARYRRLVIDGAAHERTVFMPPRSLGMFMDGSDPRVAEGFRVYRRAMEWIQQRVHAAGAELLVAILPTKQLVYRDAFPPLAVEGAAGDPARAMLQTIETEVAMAASLQAWFDQQGIHTVNATDALQSARAAGTRVFTESDDEHPNAAGYAVIADVIADGLAEIPTRDG